MKMITSVLFLLSVGAGAQMSGTNGPLGTTGNPGVNSGDINNNTATTTQGTVYSRDKVRSGTSGVERETVTRKKRLQSRKINDRGNDEFDRTTRPTPTPILP